MVDLPAAGFDVRFQGEGGLDGEGVPGGHDVFSVGAGLDFVAGHIGERYEWRIRIMARKIFCGDGSRRLSEEFVEI